MKVVIMYGTKYGFTEKCSFLLAEKIKCPVGVFNLTKKETPELSEAEILVVGSSVYAGKINKEVREFLNKNLDIISTKKVALFTCNMNQGEGAEKQLQTVFPQAIYDHAKAVFSLGGKFDFSKLNFLEKTIIKKISKVSKDVEDLKMENIDKLAGRINHL